jgi:PAS domain S-box-containing protein
MTALRKIRGLNWGSLGDSPAPEGRRWVKLVLRYGCAGGFAGLALLARLALEPAFHDCDPFPTFLVAVLAANWLCGLGPCLTALGLGTAGGVWFFLRSGHQWSLHGAGQWFDLTTYVTVGLVIAFYGWARRKAEARLHAEVQQRKATEEALRASEARFRGYAQSTQDVIWILDPAHQHFEHLSPAFETVWGRPRTGLEPAQWFETIHPADRPQVLSALTPSRNGARPRLEYRIFRPDGSMRWISDSGFPIYEENGALRSLVGIARDITEQKELDKMLRSAQGMLEQRVQERTAELQQSLQSMREFTYSIAHNLFAPLRASHGFAELLLARCEPQLDAQGRDFVRRIADAAARMSNLLESLLAYGRVASSDASLDQVKTAEVVEAALRRIRGLPGGSHAQIEVQPSLPPVLANASLLGEVLFQLLRNAVQFVAPGATPRINICAELRTGTVRLSIQDNGIGIDPAFHAEIFSTFSRLTHDGTTGTGMGLAIVQKAVDRMRGKLGLESQPDQGSCFWLELPAVK